ncbi:MAG: hypothetical protein OER74_20575 [Desulfobacteraceae bacterium]|nr:hypothetical protein [Desulfobacteraceae bacterium]
MHISANIRVQRALPVPLCGSFGFPLKGDVLLKSVYVKSAYLWLAGWPVLNYGQTGITGRPAQPFKNLVHFKLLQRFFRQSQRTLTPATRDRQGPSNIPPCGEGPGFSGQNKISIHIHSKILAKVFQHPFETIKPPSGPFGRLGQICYGK